MKKYQIERQMKKYQIFPDQLPKQNRFEGNTTASLQASGKKLICIPEKCGRQVDCPGHGFVDQFCNCQQPQGKLYPQKIHIARQLKFHLALKKIPAGIEHDLSSEKM